MKKFFSSFVCQECGYDSPQWLGKCPECGNWNSLKEIKVPNSASGRASSQRVDYNLIQPKALQDISYSDKKRLTTSSVEIDTVLGGGIVLGSVTLLAGDPGVGKSTLLLQTALVIAKQGIKGQVLYISGEESEEQVKLRAERIATVKDASSFLLLSTTDTDAAIAVIERIKPALVVIDSIQTMESANVGGLAGSVGQVRYAAAMFIKTAKTIQIPTILVGHVTKEGMVAGPMLLSHMVDTVLFLEGEKTTNTRILRSLKNRFGPVDEVGIFTMEGEGLNEVKNPEQLFVSNIDKKVPGSVLVSTLEGTRPFLVEIQGLTVNTKLPVPRRVASGVDTRRLELLLAVLQKQCNLPFGGMDVFVNVAGGLKLTDRACDLGICLALYSSLKNIPLSKTVAIAEVGLLGELRPVPGFEKRVREAKKLGFNDIISSKTHETLADVIKTVSKISTR